jgi:hypothetical protein
MLPMTPSFTVSDTFTAPVDPEHSAIRLTVIGLFIVGWALSFFALNTIISSQGLNILAILLSFALTALLTQQVERVLKRRWPSGRVLQAADGRIQLARGGHVQQEIRTGQQVNVLTWRFEIRRRSRVPKGWYMIACALEQDDVYVPVYTFMSPQAFEELNAGGHFTPLVSRKELDDKNAAQGDLRLAGEQRRLHMAENARWNSGAEMTASDFKRYVVWLQGRFPQWMPAVLQG